MHGRFREGPLFLWNARLSLEAAAHSILLPDHFHDALDCIMEMEHTKGMWTVRHTDEFQAWFDGLDEKKRTRVLAKTYVLKLNGPKLGRPTVDTVKGSTIKNLKEMRFVESCSYIRIFFYFDEARSALLLIGGDKRGKNQKDFYTALIEQAEKIVERYKHGNS